jgi:hypothetical protein
VLSAGTVGIPDGGAITCGRVEGIPVDVADVGVPAVLSVGARPIDVGIQLDVGPSVPVGAIEVGAGAGVVIGAVSDAVEVGRTTGTTSVALVDAVGVDASDATRVAFAVGETPRSVGASVVDGAIRSDADVIAVLLTSDGTLVIPGGGSLDVAVGRSVTEATDEGIIVVGNPPDTVVGTEESVGNPPEYVEVGNPPDAVVTGRPVSVAKADELTPMYVPVGYEVSTDDTGNPVSVGRDVETPVAEPLSPSGGEVTVAE